MELLRLSDSVSLVNHKPIPTKVPELFYLAKYSYGQKESDLFGQVNIQLGHLAVAESSGKSLLADIRQPDGYEYRFNRNAELTVFDANDAVIHKERFLHRISSVAPSPADPTIALVTAGSRVALCQFNTFSDSR
jgi:hypothetical protein